MEQIDKAIYKYGMGIWIKAISQKKSKPLQF